MGKNYVSRRLAYANLFTKIPNIKLINKVVSTTELKYGKKVLKFIECTSWLQIQYPS